MIIVQGHGSKLKSPAHNWNNQACENQFSDIIIMTLCSCAVTHHSYDTIIISDGP